MEHNHHTGPKDQNESKKMDHSEHSMHNEHPKQKEPTKMDHSDHSKYKNHTNHHEMMIKDFKKKFIISTILTIPILFLSPLIQELLGYNFTFDGDKYILFLLATIIFFYGGSPFLKGSYEEFKKKNLGMMTLVAWGISASYLYSSVVVFGLTGKFFFWELATLVDIMLLGHWFEMKSVVSASNLLEKLTKLMPSTGHLLSDNGEIKDVNLDQVHKGNKLLVKPGEKVPLDGKVIDGKSNVNESMITGESNPVLKEKNSSVVGGSVNLEGSITIEVTATGEDGYISNMVKMVEEAQKSKSRTQDLANKAAFYLTLIAIFASTITLIIWQLVQSDLSFSLERLVSVAVISCPHALGLAVPLVVAVSTSLSASNGLLIRNRTSFEQARNIDTIVFDKTGTLTKGQFEVTNIIQLGSMDSKQVLQYAASIEKQSEHPIAKGILLEAETDEVQLFEPKKFTSIPGEGAKAVVNNKESLMVSAEYVKKQNLWVDNKEVENLFQEGKTTVFLLVDGKLEGAIALGDLIRDESIATIKGIKRLGIEPVLLTGDNQKVANAIAKQVGIEKVFAQVLPHEKVDVIKKLQKENRKVAMVGDGINDAPALTQAEVGIAIGAGTDIAIESAGIVLVKSNPTDILNIMKLAKKTYRKMVENLIWATGYNVIAIPLAAGALISYNIVINPAVGAFLMTLSTVIVAINAKLLKLN